MYINAIYLFISIIFCVGLILNLYWKSRLYTKQRFKIMLPVVTTITSTLLAIAVIFQVVNFNHQNILEEVSQYNALSKLFIDDNTQMFIDHPEMNYYYNDLMGIKPIDSNTTRNFDLERQFSVLIFARMAKTAKYLQSTDNEVMNEGTETYLKRTMDLYTRSPTFRNYYTNCYKQIAGPAGRQYMLKNYKL